MNTPPTSTEPTKAEVLGWMRRLGRGAAEAVDQFWPDLAGAERNKRIARVRKWAELARKAGEPEAPERMTAPTGPAPEPPAPEPPPEPDFETARMSPVQLLELELAYLLADRKRVRGRKVDSLLIHFSRRISEVHAALRQARAEEGAATVAIDRSVVGVVEAVDRRHKALDLFRRAKGS